MKRLNLLLLFVLFAVPAQAGALTAAQERLCRQQAQDAMSMGEFEARLAYTNCVTATIQMEMIKMEADNCVKFGISCSGTSGSGNGGRYGCEENCLRKCSVICAVGSDPSCMRRCRAEEAACKAGCR
jgi:hypothetical protein